MTITAVPYADNVEVNDLDGKHICFAVLCPICGEVFRERAIKDEESHTGEEYAAHVEAVHPEEVKHIG